MTIKLSYEADNKALVSRVEMHIQDGVIWPELVQEFLNFLRGCGYSIPAQTCINEEADEL